MAENMKHVPAAEKPCAIAGCPEPRKAYPNHSPSTLCSRHESRRFLAIQRRLVLDEETGETVAWNTLKNRRWSRHKRAEAGR